MRIDCTYVLMYSIKKLVSCVYFHIWNRSEARRVGKLKTGQTGRRVTLTSMGDWNWGETPWIPATKNTLRDKPCHRSTVHHISLLSRKNLLCVKGQIVQGNEKTVSNGKFELKVDFGSLIIFNTSKIMICYLLLTNISKSNMIFMNFWHIWVFIGTN